MAEILVNLGPKWGHVVPLSMLENITHIDTTQDRILVKCGTKNKNGNYDMEFSSMYLFGDEGKDQEINRLLGYSNGVISKDDAQAILDSITAQTGVTTIDLLSEPAYDISYIKQIWSAALNKPYMRFSIQYDPENETVLVSENHNDEFMRVPPAWGDEEMLSALTDEEQILLFVYDVMHKMVEPFLPEDDIIDPTADIPPMRGMSGGLATQRVDLADIDQSNVFTTLGELPK